MNNKQHMTCFTITGGIKALIVHRTILLNILLLAVSVFRNPLKAISALRSIRRRRSRIFGQSRTTRYFRSNGLYYFSDTIPGWPSKSFNAFVRAEIKRISIAPDSNPPLHTVIMSITNRCPLRCRHCYEWLNLGTTDSLSLTDLRGVIRKLREINVRHIQLSGGEPLVRFDDLIELLESESKDCRFWLLTSGYLFTLVKAQMLKKAGLTGADISLDHWDEKIHNDFRNNDKSFFWAREAVINCNRTGILPALSLCATREFVTVDNLEKYLELARTWGVSMIRILEPRATGRYKGMDVSLSSEQLKILGDFYLKVNSSNKYSNYPLILYPGFYQRRIGCYGAGNRYFYIDSIGDIHACPFCIRKTGNAIKDPLPESISQLLKTGCHAFEMKPSD